MLATALYGESAIDDELGGADRRHDPGRGAAGRPGMTEIRIPDLREPQRDADEQQIHYMALSMQVDRTGGPAGCSRAPDGPLGPRRPDAGGPPGGPGRGGRRRRGTVGAREVPDSSATRRTAGGPPALRGLRGPLPGVAEVPLEPPIIVVGLPRSRDDPPGQRPGQRHPAPVASLVGDRRAHPGARRRAGPRRCRPPPTCACWPTTRPAGRCPR